MVSCNCFSDCNLSGFSLVGRGFNSFAKSCGFHNLNSYGLKLGSGVGTFNYLKKGSKHEEISKSCSSRISDGMIAPINAVAAAEGSAEGSIESPSSATHPKERKFHKCAKSGSKAPEAIAVGSNLGPGITEPLSKELRSKLQENDSPAPSTAVGVRHLDSGESVFVDKEGNDIGSLSKGSSDSATQVQPYGLVFPDEAKRILGACLGFSWESGPIAEAIFREVTNVKTAVKFVVRRIGLGAAIGCAGGIVWEYI